MGDVQLPWPLAHSLPVSSPTPSPNRPCGLQGVQGQLMSRVFLVGVLGLGHGEGLS